MNKLKLATVKLESCSGYYISSLGLDEWLLDLAEQIELVYSPFADIKEYPEEVDIALVEGSVASKDNLELIKMVRDRTKILLSFGDCAAMGNFAASHNQFDDPESSLKSCYPEAADSQNQISPESGKVPVLLERVLSVYDLVEVDVYLPGCPPNANIILGALEMLLMGEVPHLMGEKIKFS